MSGPRPGGWTPSKPREVAELPTEHYFVKVGRRPSQHFRTRAEAEKSARRLAEYTCGQPVIVFHAMPLAGWLDDLHDRSMRTGVPGRARTVDDHVGDDDQLLGDE
jgi:hypothetical protein